MLVIVMSEEILILRDLADEELNKLSEDILLELRDIYIRDGPVSYNSKRITGSRISVQRV